jgi:hypothetical protein
MTAPDTPRYSETEHRSTNRQHDVASDDKTHGSAEEGIAWKVRFDRSLLANLDQAVRRFDPGHVDQSLIRRLVDRHFGSVVKRCPER